jgi:hypothetical protein
MSNEKFKPDTVLNSEDATLLKSALNAADDLCTAVISGQPGQMQLALAVARSLGDVRRRGILR